MKRYKMLIVIAVIAVFVISWFYPKTSMAGYVCGWTCTGPSNCQRITVGIMDECWDISDTWYTTQAQCLSSCAY